MNAPPTVKWPPTAFQRPCSTHTTGTSSELMAGTSVVSDTTRFCLAPWSSSPSIRRIGRSPRFTTRTLGTCPPPGTSSTRASPRAAASPSV